MSIQQIKSRLRKLEANAVQRYAPLQRIKLIAQPPLDAGEAVWEAYRQRFKDAQATHDMVIELVPLKPLVDTVPPHSATARD